MPHDWRIADFTVKLGADRVHKVCGRDYFGVIKASQLDEIRSEHSTNVAWLFALLARAEKRLDRMEIDLAKLEADTYLLQHNMFKTTYGFKPSETGMKHLLAANNAVVEMRRDVAEYRGTVKLLRALCDAMDHRLKMLQSMAADARAEREQQFKL